jgi:Fur family ferric uptake transcriptional regulator
MARLTRDEAATLLERFRRYLRDHQLPVTRQRDQVAAVVLGADGHLSVEEIERELRQRNVRVGTATVYRTLEVLVKSGLVRAHNFGEGFKRYEPAPTPQSHHEHLICERCGSVIEFSNERLERMIPIIADEHQFQVRRHRVELYGLCRACRARELGGLA